MKFGLRYCNTNQYVEPAKAVELAQAAEETGFESIWTIDHVVVPMITRRTIPTRKTGG